jgi:peroxiredoxin
MSMPRSGWLVVLLLLTSCGSNRLAGDWQPLNPPIPAPEFTLQKLDGGSVTLSELRGRVILMEFWATWCGPCRHSTPSLDVIYRRFHDRGVEVLLVNAGEAPEAVRHWAERRFTATILLDPDHSVARLYGVSGIPRLVIIDQEGRILYDKSGYRGGLEQNLTILLNELLGDLRRTTEAATSASAQYKAT